MDASERFLCDREGAQVSNYNLEVGDQIVFGSGEKAITRTVLKVSEDHLSLDGVVPGTLDTGRFRYCHLKCLHSAIRAWLDCGAAHIIKKPKPYEATFTATLNYSGARERGAGTDGAPWWGMYAPFGEENKLANKTFEVTIKEVV